MARPYSNDFRQKVIEAIELDGLKKSEASELFRVSRNTINLWLKRRAATGSLHPKPRSTPPRSPIITDWDKFRAFVQQQGDKTQSEMAQLWDTPTSQSTFSRALQQIHYSRKKKRTAITNEMKPNEPSL
jgi:transposase